MSPRRTLLPVLVFAMLALAAPASAWATTSDLAVTSTAPATVPEQQNFDITATVTNNGPDDAQNVNVEFTIPPSRGTFVGAVPSQGVGVFNIGTGQLVFNFGTIAHGNSANIKMTFDAIARGTIETTPTTSFNPVNSQEDPNTANNAVTTDIVVTGLTAAAPSFADQPLGTIGPAQIVTLTNASSESVTFGELPVTGAAAFDYFSFGNECAGATVAAGGSCTLALRFAPSELGARSAQIDFAPTSGPVDPLELDFSGNGIPMPVDTGPQGPPGEPAFKLTLASAVKRLTARHGHRVTLAYASTLKARVVLDVLEGKRRVARVKGRARQGSNRIRWNGRSHGRAAKAGRYQLRLTATNGNQKTTLKVPLRLR